MSSAATDCTGWASIAVRKAVRGDGAVIHAMALELARSHGHEKDFTARPEDFDAVLAQPDPKVGALIGMVDGVPAGSAFWHRSFTTFKGREVMYLEDLSVLPQFQRRGVGRALLTAVARLAVDMGFPSVYWLMMGWNDGARALYQATGAEIEENLCLCVLQGDALRRLSA